MRYHLFDRVRICETTGMQDGYLRIDVVNRENNFPIEGAEVSVSYGNYRIRRQKCLEPIYPGRRRRLR